VREAAYNFMSGQPHKNNSAQMKAQEMDFAAKSTQFSRIFSAVAPLQQRALGVGLDV
jgi:hypothetical protein